MAAVRLTAFRALAAAIERAIGDLADHVSIEPTDSSQTMPFSDPLDTPSLVIERQRFDFIPDQAGSVVHDPGGNIAIVNVGRHEGRVTLRLSTSDRDERDELEQEILELWLGQPGRPGILVTPVVGVPRFGLFTCAWELEDGDWRDEMVFTRARQSELNLTAQIPALASQLTTPSVADALQGDTPTLEPVFTIDSLRLALTEDFDATFDETVTTGPTVEVVQINQDGTLTPV